MLLYSPETEVNKQQINSIIKLPLQTRKQKPLLSNIHLAYTTSDWTFLNVFWQL